MCGYTFIKNSDTQIGYIHDRNCFQRSQVFIIYFCNKNNWMKRCQNAYIFFIIDGVKTD